MNTDNHFQLMGLKVNPTNAGDWKETETVFLEVSDLETIVNALVDCKKPFSDDNLILKLLNILEEINND